METRNLRSGTVQAALFLILFGMVFLAATMEIGGLNWGNIWPAFVMIVGLAPMAQVLITRDVGQIRRGWAVLVGSFTLLLGAFFFVFTLGLASWSDQERLWPFYLLILGAAALVSYVASGLQRNGLLVVGVLFVLLGVSFLVATLSGILYDWDWWQRYGIDTWFGGEWARTWWPVYPMAVGLALLVVAALVGDLRVRSGLVLAGSIPFLVGVFFLATTLGVISWEDQGRLWPIYPLIVGVGALAAYLLSNGTQRGYLVPAAIFGVIGLVFLPVVLINNSLIGQIWPVFLIVAGALLLVPWVRGQGQGTLHHR